MVAAYRLNFQVEAGAAVTVDVTADERYELFLDGRRIGRGSERGDNEHWFFETYELALSPGSLVLVARVWSLGDFAPAAQLSVQPGFFLRTQDPSAISLGTGQAPGKQRGSEDIHFPLRHLPVRPALISISTALPFLGDLKTVRGRAGCQRASYNRMT